MRKFAVFAVFAVYGSSLLAQSPAVDPKSRTELGALVQASKFTLFNPLRSNNGVGAIVSFDQNQNETIVARPGQCLPIKQVKPERGRVEVMNIEFILAKGDKASASLSRLATKGVDLSAALGQGSVSQVRFRLIDPFEDTITALDAREIVRRSTKNSPCAKEFAREGNLILHSVLGSKGIEFSFHSNEGARLSLTANMLKLFGFSAESARSLAGQASLRFDNTELFIGYRAWAVANLAGSATTGFELVELSQDDIRKMKAHAASFRSSSKL